MRVTGWGAREQGYSRVGGVVAVAASGHQAARLPILVKKRRLRRGAQAWGGVEVKTSDARPTSAMRSHSKGS